MKVVLLADGLGARIAEESVYRPKPMVEIGVIGRLCHRYSVVNARPAERQISSREWKSDLQPLFF